MWHILSNYPAIYVHIPSPLSLSICHWICLRDQPHASAFVSKIKWNQQQCYVCTVNTLGFSCTNTSHTNQHTEASNRPEAATVDLLSMHRGYKIFYKFQVNCNIMLLFQNYSSCVRRFQKKQKDTKYCSKLHLHLSRGCSSPIRLSALMWRCDIGSSLKMKG